jgi:hypothetical protein
MKADRNSNLLAKMDKSTADGVNDLKKKPKKKVDSRHKEDTMKSLLR